MQHFGIEYELNNEEPYTSTCEGGDDESNKQCECFYENHCQDVLYYYHSDHTVSRFSVIGSSTFLTDALGIPYETPLIDCQAQRKVNIGVPSGHNFMHSESATLKITDEFMLYLPFGEAMAHQKIAGWGTPYTFTGKEQDADTGLHYFSLSRPQDGRARYLDTRLSIWFGVDPLAEKYPGWSPYNYVLNNPVRLIDPTGMSPEDSDWIPSVDNKGNIILTAEKGDNLQTLIDFFGDEENAKENLPTYATNKNVSYQEGDKVKLKEDNKFSLTMKYFFKNASEFKGKESYDCKELCRQLILNDASIENSWGGEYTPSMLLEFGKDWAKKEKTSEQKFGKTFSYWNPASFMLGDHAAIFFGQDKKGTEYFLSKNGAKGPLVIMSINELKKVYSLYNIFRTNYTKK